jgi:hypothetical protein
MHEYDAIRGEVETTLGSQVAILSFGSATVGLLVAAAAALWRDQTALTGMILILGVPLVCFLTLAVYSGELVRLMRAGLFLNHLECSVNEALHARTSGHADRDGRAEEPASARGTSLTWEQWSSIRKDGADIDRLNRLAIMMVFLVLAIGFTFAGYLRLHSAPDIREIWATIGLVTVLLVGSASILWLTYLGRFAYSYRQLYTYV